MGGKNTTGKLFYFIGVIILIYLSVKNPSTFYTGWLVLYLLIGIILIRNSLALTVFFAINILLSLAFYVQHGYLKFIGLVLVTLIGFIASIGAVKPKKVVRRKKRAAKLERKAEQIKKELDGIDGKIPKVEVYGKEEAKEKASKAAAKKKADKTKRAKRKAKKTTKTRRKTAKKSPKRARKKSRRKKRK
ncbi:hypothetical protein KY325_04620 [Candidatus Woesearchaeota archaeon]|nr:hypothetical protein [Candidatus Woesearchaeota archaeon]